MKTIQSLIVLTIVFFGGVALGYSKKKKDYVEDYIIKTEKIKIQEEPPSIFGQNLNLVLKKAYKSDTIHAVYINRYARIAQREYELYGIPTSIKLSQFLLEGGYNSKNPNGSRLAKEGNNPFGIKYYGDNVPKRIDNWEDLAYSNQFVLSKDDCKTLCRFVKFKGIWHSFRFHSKFLVGENSHYTKHLTSGDYKDWARALSKGNYASDINYERKLISLIEKYDLYLLDTVKP
jgi:flagellum-specific peptidoglycan hydrolase FlgJ